MVLVAPAVETAAEWPALEASPVNRLIYESYNALLAGELSVKKGREVLQTLDPSGIGWAQALVKHPMLTDYERHRVAAADPSRLQKALEGGATMLIGPDLPEGIFEAEVCAPALFVHGNSDLLNRPCISIVGTRSATTYGKACAMKFAEAFARAGVVVVSGGAMGIDTAAHRGAMDAGGDTVAVLPCGIDVTYPVVNQPLFNEIRDRGCLVSQFCCGRETQKQSPLMRNVTVAAMCIATVVIEAPGKSGSIHTASQAGELGREVFVVPGPIDRASFIGSHNLVRDGATLVWHPDQVLESLGLDAVAAPKKQKLVGVAGQIMSVLTSDAQSAEKIVEKTGLGAHEVLAELTMLELEGRIIRDAGGYALKI